MILDLKKLFAQDGFVLPFQYQIDFSSVEVSGVHPFVAPVAVEGTVKNHTGFAQFEASVTFDFAIPCDRCTKLVQKRYGYTFSHVLVRSLQDDKNDEYIQVENDSLDVDELLRADILLELPIKFVCSEDCKGLCPQCGKNLNDGPCECDARQIDPRLEALKKLID